MKRCAAIAVVLLFTALDAFSQADLGSIRGRVTDNSTKEGLPSVNIVVKGTYYGAATNIDGWFTIQKVNAGTYVVEVTLLGYKAVQFGAVKVEAGKEMRLDVGLEETALSLGQEVTVIGEKPMFDIEETSSKRSLKSDELVAAGVQNVRDVVAMQVGVVKSDDDIHIRGGRSYETAFLVDGISVQDPLSGRGFGLSLPPGAVQEVEVITGGYNAEYGQATSGVVNFTTREGSDRYSGSISHQQDHLSFNNNSPSSANTDIYELSLGGPEPITSLLLPLLGVEVPGKVSFFANANVNLSDGYTRWVQATNAFGQPAGTELKVPGGLTSSIFNGTRFSPRRSNNWSGLSKLTWKATPTVRVSYTFAGSVSINQNTQTIQTTLDHQEPQPGYQYLFQNIPDNANTFTQISTQQALILTHTLSNRTFYEVRLSRFQSHVRGDANGLSWENYLEPRDIVTYPIVYYNLGHDTVGVVPGDGFYDVGNPTVWRDHSISEVGLKLDVTSHFDETNKFKAGVEFRFMHMQMIDITSPWVRPMGYDNDVYQVDPAQGALYAQDNISFGGMILNFGLRFDYWFPGRYVDEAAEKGYRLFTHQDVGGGTRTDTLLSLVSPTIRQQYVEHTNSLFGHRWKGRLSPRLAIAHPVSDNQTLFFSYGHFSKFPRPQYIYSKLFQGNSRATTQTIGNPDLNPETTVAYELGIRNQLSADDVLSVTAYYKDIFDYITARTVPAQPSRVNPGSYTTYINLDYARSRGVEVEYKKRLSDWFRAAVTASYSLATGKSSSATEALFNIQQGQDENVKENYLSWDRPYQGSLVLNLSIKKDQALFGFGNGVLDDINVFTRLFFQSGKRYTPYQFVGFEASSGRPQFIADATHPYSAVGKSHISLDVNIEKTIDLTYAKFALTFSITNLLDRRNVQIIDQVTPDGDAYDYNAVYTYKDPTTGRDVRIAGPTPSSWNDPRYPDLQAPVDPFPYNPARYGEPRTFRAGVSVRF